MRGIAYRRLDLPEFEIAERGGIRLVRVPAESLKELTAEAFHDLSYYLRSDFVEELAAIAGDVGNCANERMVCGMLLRNAIVAAEGALPLCQDTGTATIFAWRGEDIHTGIDDAAAISEGVRLAWERNHLRASQVAATTIFESVNTRTNLPAQIDIRFEPGGEYKFLFMAKGGGSANKTVFHQGTRAMLEERRMAEWLEGNIRQLGVAACPPYAICVVIGGTSPENNLRALKLASAGWLDQLPTEGDGSGAPFRVPEWEGRVMRMAAESGWGAQFGGAHLAVQARVIRLPRHAGSCPMSFGVSCSAHRNMLGKINAEGVFLEKLERNPSRHLKGMPGDAVPSVAINLDQPLPHVLSQLRGVELGGLIRLNGTMVVARDAAHLRFRELLRAGRPLPEYLLKHALCYAGPARTPEGCATGSFGPTTAQRMDEYQDELMRQGASLITVAKGNRTAVAAEACGKHGGFYLGMIGGAAAVTAKENIIASEVIDYDDLGMEAVHRIVVRDLPAFLLINHRGESFYAH